MTLRVWQLAALVLAAAALGGLLLPRAPGAGVVALVGVGVAALLLARTRAIRLELLAEIRSLAETRDRERAEVETERRTYLGRLHEFEQAVVEHQQALSDVIGEIDRRTPEGGVAAAQAGVPKASRMRPVDGQGVRITQRV